MARENRFPYALRDIYKYRQYRHRGNTEEYSKELVYFTDFKFFYPFMFKDEGVVENIERELNASVNNLVYWTNDAMAQENTGYFFYNTFDSTNTPDFKSEKAVAKIMLSGNNRISAEDFCKAKAILRNVLVLHFTPNEYQFQFLNNLKLESSKEFVILKDWQTAFDMLIEKKLLNIEFESDQQKESLVAIKSFFLEFAGVDIPTTTYSVKEQNYRNSDLEIKHIMKVIEKRINNVNYRIFAYTKVHRYGYLSHGIKMVDENDQYYNYIDDDRIYFNSKSDKLFLELGLNPKVNNKLTIITDVFGAINDRKTQLLGRDNCVISAGIYRFFNERYKHLVSDTYDNDDENKENQEEIILDKYMKLLNLGKDVKIDELIVSKKKIEVADQPFKIEFDKNFLDIDKNMVKELRKILKREDVRYNFNELYERILQMSSLKVVARNNVREEDYKDFKATEFTLNGMKIKISKETRVRINDIFCRIDDVFEILNRAICYTSIDDYEKYIEDVSHIGHKWKAMIGTGNLIKIYNPFGKDFTIDHGMGYAEDSLSMRFSYRRDRRRKTTIYLYLNGQPYEIKYKHKFLREFSMPENHFTINDIKTKLRESVEELKEEEIFELITNAVKEAEIIRIKGKQLVEATIKDIGAKDTEIIVQGSKVFGYLFVGNKSGAEYFVDKKSLAVYKKVEGVWNRRCVVNDSSKNRIFEDWLANRLVNVFNEPQYIHTLHNA